MNAEDLDPERPLVPPRVILSVLLAVNAGLLAVLAFCFLGPSTTFAILSSNAGAWMLLAAVCLVWPPLAYRIIRRGWRR